MFSGLTNQVSSWMGAAKGEPQDEEVPTPTKEATGEATAEGEKQRCGFLCLHFLLRLTVFILAYSRGASTFCLPLILVLYVRRFVAR